MGETRPSRHFEIASAPVPEPGDKQFLVRNEFLSVEPAMRGWVLDVPNYLTAVPVGSPMRSFGIGEVVVSQLEGYAAGDLVVARKRDVLDRPDEPRRVKDVVVVASDD